MDSSQLLNTAALVASLAALTVSIFFAVRQSNLMRAANQLPVVISFFAEYRSDEFLRRERFLWENLPGEHDPAGGFSAMPEPLRTYMFHIGIYYQTVAYLVEFKVFDKRLAYLGLHYRLIRTWRKIAPFVDGERNLRGAEQTFLNALERFVKLVESEDSRAFGSGTLKYGPDNKGGSAADARIAPPYVS